MEYANILRVMAGLNEEIKVLRERLSAASSDNEQLRAARDELLAAQPDAHDPPALEPDDAAAYRARIADLQVCGATSTASNKKGLLSRRYDPICVDDDKEADFRSYIRSNVKLG